jgi:hypothetical protein
LLSDENEVSRVHSIKSIHAAVWRKLWVSGKRSAVKFHFSELVTLYSRSYYPQAHISFGTGCVNKQINVKFNIVVEWVPLVTELFLHGISSLVVLSISVRSVRKTFVIVNVAWCYSPQEACFVPKAGQN